MEIASVERRLHEGCLLNEIISEYDIRNEKREGSLTKRELRLVGETEVLISDEKTSHRHDKFAGIDIKWIVGVEYD